ncbi:MAG: hypothetical protein WCR49_13045, partial [Opitutae bacterium]
MQHGRLEEVERVPEKNDGRGGRVPRAEARQEAHEAEGKIGEADFEDPVGPVGLPAQALGIGAEEEDVAYEREEPDDADVGDRDDDKRGAGRGG